MDDMVTYRELIKEVRTLRTEMNIRFDSLEDCVEKKVNIKTFEELKVQVGNNTGYITKAIGAVGVISVIIGIIGRDIWNKVRGG